MTHFLSYSACSGGTVEELEQGIFMTPDYPLDYENNMFCEWHFNGTDGEVGFHGSSPPLAEN